MALNSEIAAALRDINDQIGDLDSAIWDFERPPPITVITQEEPERSRRRLPAMSSATRRVTLLVLVGVTATATAIVTGPTVARWREESDPTPAAAIVDGNTEPTQRVVVNGDTMYLEGLVPDQAVSDVLETTAVSAVGRERVVNNLRVSGRAVYDPDHPIRISAAELVLFTSGAAALDDQYRPLIDLAADLMKAEPASTLAITGHTDDVGPEGANLRLSIDRADTVAQLVIEHGIDRARLIVDGRGETEPIDTNETHAGRAVNRRVEFSILGIFGR